MFKRHSYNQVMNISQSLQTREVQCTKVVAIIDNCSCSRQVLSTQIQFVGKTITSKALAIHKAVDDQRCKAAIHEALDDQRSKACLT